MDNKMRSLLPLYVKSSLNFTPENGDNFRFIAAKFGEDLANLAKKNINESCPIVSAKLNSTKTAINVYYYLEKHRDRSHSCIHLYK